MASLVDRALGLLLPGRSGSASDSRPAPASARLIPGAAAARELCMLPTDVDLAGLAALPGGSGGKRIVELKADGIRALHIDGTIVTREGTPLDCALHCQPALRRLEAAFGMPMMFDGEYVEEDGFNATLAAQQRREGQGVLWLFDAVPLDRWMAGRDDTPCVLRLSKLRGLLEQAQSPFVGMLDWLPLSAADTAAKAAELWRMGYEGIVTKHPDSSYVRARSDDWRRLKQRFRATLPVIDILERAGKRPTMIVGRPGKFAPIRLPIADTGVIASHRKGDALRATVEYELTTGTERSVRGAKLISIEGGKA